MLIRFGSRTYRTKRGSFPQCAMQKLWITISAPSVAMSLVSGELFRSWRSTPSWSAAPRAAPRIRASTSANGQAISWTSRNSKKTKAHSAPIAPLAKFRVPEAR